MTLAFRKQIGLLEQLLASLSLPREGVDPINLSSANQKSPSLEHAVVPGPLSHHKSMHGYRLLCHVG